MILTLWSVSIFMNGACNELGRKILWKIINILQCLLWFYTMKSVKKQLILIQSLYYFECLDDVHGIGLDLEALILWSCSIILFWCELCSIFFFFCFVAFIKTIKEYQKSRSQDIPAICYFMGLYLHLLDSRDWWTFLYFHGICLKEISSIIVANNLYLVWNVCISWKSTVIHYSSYLFPILE